MYANGSGTLVGRQAYSQIPIYRDPHCGFHKEDAVRSSKKFEEVLTKNAAWKETSYRGHHVRTGHQLTSLTFPPPSRFRLTMHHLSSIALHYRWSQEIKKWSQQPAHSAQHGKSSVGDPLRYSADGWRGRSTDIRSATGRAHFVRRNEKIGNAAKEGKDLPENPAGEDIW